MNKYIRRWSAFFLALMIGIGVPSNSMGIEFSKDELSSGILSPEEEEYVAAHPEVFISVDVSSIPYAFVQHDGSCDGIILNMIAAVVQDVGLEAICVAADSYTEALKACKNGETQLVAGVVNEGQTGLNNGIMFSEPFINVSYSAVSKKLLSDMYAKDASYKVALCKGCYVETAMRETMPGYDFVECNNGYECLEKVLENEADIALLANNSVNYYLNQRRYMSMHVVQVNKFSWDLCFGVNENCDPLLISVLNKGIATLTDSDINQAIYTGAVSALAFSRSWLDELLDRSEVVAIISGLIIALVALVVFLLLFRYHKGKEILREEAYKKDIFQKNLLAHYDDLTGLPNRRKLGERLNDLQTRSDKEDKDFLLLFSDLNCFKDINDRYGHDIGDKALILVAEALKKILQGEDEVFHLSGDEFILLHTMGAADSVKCMLKRVTDAVANVDIHTFAPEAKLSTAVGGCLYSETRNLHQMLKIADERMYEMKEQAHIGR